MQYLLLVYGEEKLWYGRPQEVRDRVMAECDEYADEMRAAGVFLGGAPLHPISTATTIRKPVDKPVVTDGPFAETKEVLAGYHLVECKDLDEAIAWGAKFPALNIGLTIEVRPVMKD